MYLRLPPPIPQHSLVPIYTLASIKALSNLSRPRIRHNNPESRHFDPQFRALINHLVTAPPYNYNNTSSFTELIIFNILRPRYGKNCKGVRKEYRLCNPQVSTTHASTRLFIVIFFQFFKNIRRTVRRNKTITIMDYFQQQIETLLQAWLLFKRVRWILLTDIYYTNEKYSDFTTVLLYI